MKFGVPFSLLIPVTASFWLAVLSTLTCLLLFTFLLLVGISQNGLKSWAPPFLLPISIFYQEELGLTVTEIALRFCRDSIIQLVQPLSSELGGFLSLWAGILLRLHLYCPEFQRDSFIPLQGLNIVNSNCVLF